ncbi:D-glycerate dehydrogenase [Allopusillimonas soli]|uniref:D-glycerate dehydrogenase n=1 Tax=Allopusillimonas soli TaxID=659016 RepID=A0A853FIG6_9BURK|nr:D-glycerate dehydrogenase [Allopusillimonas soli]NYT38550.1 D-glycerate dehydrogenase [Allopusillimonas soli]TEA71735.1 D-glycerate dehydrogenase [Allopusillimonas soli]
MSHPYVIVSAPVPEDLRTSIEANFNIVDVPVGKRLEDALDSDRLQEIAGIVCTVRTKLDEGVMASMPKLRVISNFAVGFDNVDVAAANARNILVCNTPRVLDSAVADLVFGMIIILGRDMLNGDTYVRDGTWASKGAPALTRDIRGKTLGLLGMGRIGRVVAKTAKAFDMNVIYHNRNRCSDAESEGLAEYRDREALLAEADFLSIHVPLTDATRNSIGERELKIMKSSAYLINTSRGAVVDEQALVEALKSGEIAGAGLDVMVKEPLPAESPLCSMRNVVLQAHVGSGTVETRRAMIDLATRNLIDALTNKQPEAMVNPQVWGSKAE